MIPVQITDWNIYLRHGEQFLKTARSAHEKKKRTFTAEAIYNLTCMAIEKLIMAFLMKRGDLAENHTMVDLLHAMERHLGSNTEIGTRLRYLGGFQQICELDTFTILGPTNVELQKIVETGEALHQYLSPYLYENNS